MKKPALSCCCCRGLRQSFGCSRFTVFVYMEWQWRAAFRRV